MDFNAWYLLVGALLLLMVFLGRRLERLPISTAMLYLVFGYAMAEFDWLNIDPFEHQAWLERLSEIAVIVSLFSVGLKLREPLDSKLWRLPVLLAFVSMSATVGLIAAAGVFGLGLSWGAAVLLGAVLAPTDPVLASDVQVKGTHDTDRVRFSLTGEAGLNDGTAFPFVMLGLGLLGLHSLGDYGWRWVAVDVVWATLGGLGLGALLGTAVARLVVYLRQHHQEATGLDDFLAMGLIAIAYGLAHTVGVYGFLSVFAAGLSLRIVERKLSPEPGQTNESTGEMEKSPAHMAKTVLFFNEHLERIGELMMVLIAGALLSAEPFSWTTVGFALLLFVVIRPVSVLPVALGLRDTRRQAWLIAWFGVRGIGSLYYLFYAIGHGVEPAMAERLLTITSWVICLSVLLHGITVTPLMAWHESRCGSDAA